MEDIKKNNDNKKEYNTWRNKEKNKKQLPKPLTYIPPKYRSDILEEEQNSPVKLKELSVRIDHKTYNIPICYIQPTIGSLFYQFYTKNKNNEHEKEKEPITPTHDPKKSKYFWNELCISFVKEGEEKCAKEEICSRIHVNPKYLKKNLNINIEELSYLCDHPVLYKNCYLVVQKEEQKELNENDKQQLKIPFASILKTQGFEKFLLSFSSSFHCNQNDQKTFAVCIQQICPFHLNGKCYYKSRCKNIHIDRKWWIQNNQIFNFEVIVKSIKIY